VGLDISHCPNAEKIPKMNVQGKSFVLPNI
jgi:hypothetical protein